MALSSSFSTSHGAPRRCKNECMNKIYIYTVQSAIFVRVVCVCVCCVLCVVCEPRTNTENKGNTKQRITGPLWGESTKGTHSQKQQRLRNRYRVMLYIYIYIFLMLTTATNKENTKKTHGWPFYEENPLDRDSSLITLNEAVVMQWEMLYNPDLQVNNTANIKFPHYISFVRRNSRETTIWTLAKDIHFANQHKNEHQCSRYCLFIKEYV